MLDHLVGKPSANWKRTQVLLTAFLCGWIIAKGKTGNLPRFIQRLNHSNAGTAPWKIALGSWLAYYILQNLFLLVGLNAPEPLARLYNRSFYRATWIMTALDAGFFTAQPIRPHWLRHILSIIFSLYYLVFADDAEEKVRRVRATISVDQMRLAWQKGAENPFLYYAAKLLRPKLTVDSVLRIDRPAYHSDLPCTEVHLYYAGALDTFANHNTIVLQFPGGGFVSMSPRSHEDPIAAWAYQTGLPICSVNYKKAPEYSYPWPVEECFDVYVSLIQTRGKCIGLSGDQDLNIIILGDSAGGNLTAAVTLKILAHNEFIHKHVDSFAIPGHSQANNTALKELLPVPSGLILIYPVLDFEMSCWMNPEQLALIHEESKSNLPRSKSLQSLLEAKDHLSHASPLSVVPDVDKSHSWRQKFGLTPARDDNVAIRNRIHTPCPSEQAWESPRLAMTSRMSYFSDRIISPDMLRAMAIMYIGPHAHPDFETDYLLSPIIAPDYLLAQFPKTFMMCGEKDPLVDDTVIFSGRLRQAKEKCQTKSTDPDEEQDLDKDYRVKIIEGFSHAFLQMMAFLPESHQAARTIGDWIIELVHSTGYIGDSSPELSPSLQNIAQHKNVSITNISNHVKNMEDHVAEIATTKMDMIQRRKRGVLTGLLPLKPKS